MVRDVLVRFEGLAARLETQFVRADIFEFYKTQIQAELTRLSDAVSRAADKVIIAERLKDTSDDIEKKASKGELESLSKRVSDLEDDKKWLTRIILGFVVAGVLGAAFLVNKASGGG
jgi:hypothetical protein